MRDVVGFDPRRPPPRSSTAAVRIVGDRAFARDAADVFFITAVEGGRDLTGVKIERLEHKTVAELAEELTVRASRAKAGEDPDLAKSKGVMNALPIERSRAAGPLQFRKVLELPVEDALVELLRRGGIVSREVEVNERVRRSRRRPATVNARRGW